MPDRNSIRRGTLRVLMLLFAPILAALCCPIELRAGGASEVEENRGEVLARIVCGSCHVFPEPNVVDRKTWRDQILPRMEARLAVSPPDYSSSPEGELLRSLRIYPDEPLLSKADWALIHDFYMENAPEVPPAQGPRPEIKVGLAGFELNAARFRHTPPMTTLVKVSRTGGRIYMGDDRAKSLTVLDKTGERIQSISIGNVPVSLFEAEDGLYVTAVGSVVPSEIQNGALYFIEKKEGGFGAPKALLKNLPRAAHAEFCDFNGDGRLDVAVSMFGNHRGRFSWFENTGDGYVEQILVEKAGAIHSVAHDFNGDGFPDIGLLMAQESEAFYIFTNDGKGNFGNRLVFQKHPAFGHNMFELGDFNGDGLIDLMVVNGDNGEYESPLKNYHGVRIYLNRGGLNFEEAYFFPINGATKAMARDFDGDGDLDIAAISFFPDYIDAPRESFVYLENRGGLNFAPATFRECIAGRWIAMDVGDLDGDGGLDIVLGSYILGPTSVPQFLSELWERRGPSVVALKSKF